MRDPVAALEPLLLGAKAREERRPRPSGEEATVAGRLVGAPHLGAPGVRRRVGLRGADPFDAPATHSRR